MMGFLCGTSRDATAFGLGCPQEEGSHNVCIVRQTDPIEDCHFSSK